MSIWQSKMGQRAITALASLTGIHEELRAIRRTLESKLSTGHQVEVEGDTVLIRDAEGLLQATVRVTETDGDLTYNVRAYDEDATITAYV